MRFKLHNKKVTFEYGDSDTNKMATLDVKQRYQNLGGKISPSTEGEFFSYFPGSPYAKTALTSSMPPTYLCEGSLSLHLYKCNGQVDVLAISVYQDTKGGQKYKGEPIGDHHNLFLQHEIDNKKPDHTDEIPNRHIPLKHGVIVKGVIDNIEIKKVIIKPQS